MGQYDFSYELPSDFSNRVIQLLQQISVITHLVYAFQHCKFEYEDLGLAYYAGIKGDNWNKRALDFTFEGNSEDIEILRNSRAALKDSLGKAIRPSTSGFLIRNLLFFVNDSSLFPSTEEERLNVDLDVANVVLKDLVKIVERLVINAAYKKETSENSINDYIRDALLLMGYNEIKDQTRHGVSLTGKDAGEIDILISKDGKEIAIFEGLKLNSVNSTYIDTHILKAVVNYNALGTATFIVAYVSCINFELFWTRYIDYLRGYHYSLQIKRELKIKASPNAAIRIANMILSRDGYDFPVFFIAIHIY